MHPHLRRFASSSTTAARKLLAALVSASGDKGAPVQGPLWGVKRVG